MTALAEVPPVRQRKPWAAFAPGLALLANNFLPKSSITRTVVYVVLGYIMLELILTIRSGYIRHRPFWSRESWQRFMVAAAIPLTVCVVGIAMMTAMELRLPMTGAPRSSLRNVWALGAVGFLIGGVLIFGFMMETFARRDPNKPFTWLGRGGT